MQHTVIIQKNPTEWWKVPLCTDELMGLFETILNEAGYHLNSTTIEISFVNDKVMAELNQSALCCTGPTNILSFPAPSPEKDSYLPQAGYLNALGLLAIAPSTVLRECFLYDQDPVIHYVRLFAHGVAHLLGYDHGLVMDALCHRLEQAGSTYLEQNT